MKVSVRVTTNAKIDKIERTGDNFKIWLKSKPIDNEANLALIKIIAKYFQVPKKAVGIVSGQTSRNKIIEVNENGS